MNPMLKLIKKNFSISAEILFFVHKEFRFLSFIEVGNFDCQAQRLNWVLIESIPQLEHHKVKPNLYKNQTKEDDSFMRQLETKQYKAAVFL